MAQSAIMAAIQQICQEKNLSVQSVLDTIEAALAAAYRKDYGQKNQNIKVEYDPEVGESRVFDIKTVVEDELKAKAEAEAAEREAALERGEELPEPEVKAVSEDEDAVEEIKFNPKLHMALSDAKELKKTAEIGEEVRMELQPPTGYGRMAAQTAKQVIIQRLREAERNTIFEEYKDKQGTVLIGTVQRREGPSLLVDLGRVNGILPTDEQIERERYVFGERMKFYILAVQMGSKGPEIILSRKSPEIVRQLFTVEIPEISSGAIEIKAIAREAGSRSKVAVWTEENNIDPIGSCVGQRGARVQTIISELGGEKIDIIEWSENPQEFITHALLPAKVLSLEIDETNKLAKASVDAAQLSLAIGRNGQNVRLASRLSGYNINIIEVKDGAARELTAEEIAGALAASIAASDEAKAKAEEVAVEAGAKEVAAETKAEEVVTEEVVVEPAATKTKAKAKKAEAAAVEVEVEEPAKEE